MGHRLGPEMEVVISIGALFIGLFVAFVIYAVLTTLGIRLMRALFRLPQRSQMLSWASRHDFLYGKPLDRYERRERKGRLRD